MKFSIGSLTVSSGTTVTWINDDDMAHTVTADDNSFNSGSLKKGDSYKHTFSGAGTYPYHCTFHPTMKANVVVSY
ncbi:hypothetical protein SY85_00695 [Flavisolibacter tropicus]|uniref:Blue (type 1) copper domain-containing protein n=2 Tax=Flavisolibacter tropicus TaxID=1492898 RepID=A0A172U284_9BACT|nr:hypothetical protein SY85_00695 [Flavisolibacter tropicus]